MIDVPSYVGWILAAVSSGMVGALVYYRLDERREDKGRAAIRLSAVLREYGLKLIPSFLESYAVYDYSDMAKKIDQFWDLLQEQPEIVVKEFDEVFKRVLAQKAKSPEGRAYVQAVLDEAQPIVPTRVV